MVVGVVGGFSCSKNALIALNILYICVAFILIGVAGYGVAASSLSNFGVIIAIVMVGVFLMVIAVIGIVAAFKHHQVMLFFYMVVLFILFIVQFSVACACLAVGDQQIQNLMQHGWRLSKNDTRASVQEYWDCCGFNTHQAAPIEKSPPSNSSLTIAVDELFSHPTCSKVRCCTEFQAPKGACCDPKLGQENCPCSPCFTKLEAIVKASLRLCGGIGLFFSFTEVVGIFIALRFRNQKNPHIDPSDFL